ncbi:signal peptide peptidase SppA [Teredinibacter purpureus]|uniref:signal peptide peptidase SppA n=1 Tax=Teredinibacter purpureus TaxID=2731756 RepID=UPI0005F7F2B5|nr:signal peptide peptidase SppA [Teredinibacter purpureus]
MFKIIGFIWDKFWRLITGVRTALLNVIFLAIVISIIASLSSAPSYDIPSSTALYIAPEGYLVDQRTYNPTPADLMFGAGDQIAETPLQELIDSIIEASLDARITALVMNLNHFNGGGISKMEELGQALDAFKATGKPIYTYADNYSQQQYFLASYADTLFMNDMGNVLMTGFGTFRNYYKDAADTLAIKFHVFRVGDYKDAVEPFMRNSMSDASREHNSRWINELWQRYVTIVSHNREIPAEQINAFIASISDSDAAQKDPLSNIAQNLQLVDVIDSRNGINDALIELLGKEEDGESFNAISLEHYRRSATPTLHSDSPNIGLIVATGTIVDGYQDVDMIGGDSLSDLIAQARNDETLKALIIRVNSGGGSAFASEVIRKEILTARDNDLPIYISMGSMAASGGYWISTAANEIWSTPATLTGSIGVWGLVPNLSNALTNMGIHSDGVGTTPLSDLYNIDRALSTPAKNLIQNGVNDVYARFLNIVAEARDSDPTSVNEIAGGRVWTGETAKSLGLVDNLGSLSDLLAHIANVHALDTYQVKKIEAPLSTSEKIMQQLMKQVSLSVDGALLSNSLQSLDMLNTLGGHHANTLVKAFSQYVKPALQDGTQPAVMAHCLECYAP